MVTINHLHFQPKISRSEARNLFKQSVSNIEIAISSFCNRRCSYCPNSLHDRRSKRHFMEDSLFDSVISQLAEIDYAGRIALHRYNEPLSDPHYALRRIWQIRAQLPKANIWIYSNGDYLTPKLIRTLENAGISQLVVTSHALPKDNNFSDIQKRMIKRIEKIGLPYFDHGLSVDASEHWISVKSSTSMKHDWRAINFASKDSEGNLKMSDRGESLEIESTITRTSPCLIPFIEMQIEYDGSIWPCCNIHSDVPDHQSYKMGQLTDSSNIFDEYTNENFVKWRKALFSYEAKDKPCKKCNFQPGSLPLEMFEQVVKIRNICGI